MKNDELNEPGNPMIDEIQEVAILFLDANGSMRSWNKGVEKIKSPSGRRNHGREHQHLLTAAWPLK